jgi:hypothetical protein
VVNWRYEVVGHRRDTIHYTKIVIGVLHRLRIMPRQEDGLHKGKHGLQSSLGCMSRCDC